MMIRVNLALMETVNAQRAGEGRGWPALHPMAEYYRDWECKRRRKPVDQDGSPGVISMYGDSV